MWLGRSASHAIASITFVVCFLAVSNMFVVLPNDDIVLCAVYGPVGKWLARLDGLMVLASSKTPVACRPGEFETLPSKIWVFLKS